MLDFRHDEGQDWLVAYTQIYDLNPDKRELCNGIGHMGMQAALSDDIVTYAERIQRLDAIYRDARHEALTQVLATIKKNKKNEPLWDEASTKRLETLVIATLKEKIESLPPLTQLDFQAFFEGVELYQRGAKHPELFEEGKKPTYQQSLLISERTTSAKIEAEGGLALSDRFTGAYDNDELLTYFESLQASLTKDPPFTHPIALVLKDVSHALTVAYDPKTERWTLIDADNLNVTRFQNIKELVDKISGSFIAPPSSPLSFSTHVFTTKAHEDELKNHLDDWHSQKAFKRMHKPTSRKAHAVDQKGGSWLHIAAREGDVEMVKMLLKLNAKVDQARLDGVTPIMMAVDVGNADTVSLLLKKRANPRQEHNHQSLMGTALQKAYHGIVIILAKAIVSDITRKWRATHKNSAEEDAIIQRFQSEIKNTVKQHPQETEKAIQQFEAFQGLVTELQSIASAFASDHSIQKLVKEVSDMSRHATTAYAHGEATDKLIGDLQDQTKKLITQAKTMHEGSGFLRFFGTKSQTFGSQLEKALKLSEENAVPLTIEKRL